MNAIWKNIILVFKKKSVFRSYCLIANPLTSADFKIIIIFFNLHM